MSRLQSLLQYCVEYQQTTGRWAYAAIAFGVESRSVLQSEGQQGSRLLCATTPGVRGGGKCENGVLAAGTFS